VNRRLKNALQLIKREKRVSALQVFANALMEAMITNDEIAKHYRDLMLFGRSEMFIGVDPGCPEGDRVVIAPYHSYQ
jgi:hypothetical protein